MCPNRRTASGWRINGRMTFRTTPERIPSRIFNLYLILIYLKSTLLVPSFPELIFSSISQKVGIS